MNKEYVFAYMTAKNSVTIDSYSVLCKIGPFRKKQFAFNNIINFYVFNNQNQYQSLFITYTNDSGKTEKVQMYSQFGEQGFNELITELSNRIPNKSLNHLPEKEAFAAMKVANPKKWGAIVAFLIIFAVVTVFFIPALMHYFDFGFQETEVQQLIKGDMPSTRNLLLAGQPLYENLEETTTTTRKGSTTTTKKVYIPIVPPDWDYDSDIKVILQFDELTDDEYGSVMESSEFVGVVRNIWYEGLEKDQIEFFNTEYPDLKVADDAIMFEVTNETHNDSLMFFVWIGINGFLLIIFLVTYFKSKNK
jgi:hypothetical protein